MGNATVVGDASTFYIQIDSNADSFQFSELGNNEVDPKKMSGIMDNRNTELVMVLARLLPSDTLDSGEKSALPYWDIPYYISVGNDIIDLCKYWIFI